MKEALFNLPDPLPRGAVLLGPPDWSETSDNTQRTGRTFVQPEEALVWLKRECLADDGNNARLVFLHQDTFAGSAGTDLLMAWLEDLADLRGPYLPILLHGNLPGDQLVRFFRAGLFDAISVPIEDLQWLNMLVRAEKRLEYRHQSRLLLADTGQTQMRLRELRRQIEDQGAQAASELLRSQESLEVANRQLTEAMAELSLLYRFGRELSTARNWDKVLREILSNLAGFIGAGGAALVLRSAPGGSYSPRMTWHWEESAWDKVLVNLTDQVDGAVAESIMAPGVFRIDPGVPLTGGDNRRVIALPLEHQELRLGYLLLMFSSPGARKKVAKRYLPFLQAVQLVLSEEVASAQMLDRIRDIGSFNARVLETVRSAIWVLDEMGATVYCNRAGQELLTGREAQSIDSSDFLFELGRGRNETQNPDLTTHLPELILDARLRLDDVDGLLLSGLRAREQGEFRGEGLVVGDDGEGIPVLAQTASMPGRTRGETWLVVVAEDLRETRKLEAERMRADRLEGLVEMSASLAHEIRNPLMGLSAQAELLAEQLPTADKRSRYIEVITGEVERINNTITRLLNYVRPYAPEYEQVSLADLVYDSLDLVRARTMDKKIKLELITPAADLSDQDLGLWIDGGQIKQVLLNLLINAIDAAPVGGHVEINLLQSENIEMLDASRGTQQACSGVTLEVLDNGPGFKDGDLEKIFRPFFTTKSMGTGLGLSISHKIVVAHGGELRAARESNKTVFRMVLPRLENRTAAAGRHHKEAQ